MVTAVNLIHLSPCNSKTYKRFDFAGTITADTVTGAVFKLDCAIVYPEQQANCKRDRAAPPSPVQEHATRLQATTRQCLKILKHSVK